MSVLPSVWTWNKRLREYLKNQQKEQKTHYDTFKIER